ncbi:hypothetical protein BH09MYX1_BH09MYX1_01780 [soil metagenome]
MDNASARRREPAVPLESGPPRLSTGSPSALMPSFERVTGLYENLWEPGTSLPGCLHMQASLLGECS